MSKKIKDMGEGVIVKEAQGSLYNDGSGARKGGRPANDKMGVAKSPRKRLDLILMREGRRDPLDVLAELWSASPDEIMETHLRAKDLADVYDKQIVAAKPAQQARLEVKKEQALMQLRVGAMGVITEAARRGASFYYPKLKAYMLDAGGDGAPLVLTRPPDAGEIFKPDSSLQSEPSAGARKRAQDLGHVRDADYEDLEGDSEGDNSSSAADGAEAEEKRDKEK